MGRREFLQNATTDDPDFFTPRSRPGRVVARGGADYNETLTLSSPNSLLGGDPQIGEVIVNVRVLLKAATERSTRSLQRSGRDELHRRMMSAGELSPTRCSRTAPACHSACENLLEPPTRSWCPLWDLIRNAEVNRITCRPAVLRAAMRGRGVPRSRRGQWKVGPDVCRRLRGGKPRHYRNSRVVRNVEDAAGDPVGAGVRHGVVSAVDRRASGGAGRFRTARSRSSTTAWSQPPRCALFAGQPAWFDAGMHGIPKRCDISGQNPNIPEAPHRNDEAVAEKRACWEDSQASRR